MNIDIPKKLSDEIQLFCKSNNIENVDEFVVKLLKKGFDIEKWGDINIYTPPIDEVIPSVIEEKPKKTIHIPSIKIVKDEKPVNQPIKPKTTKTEVVIKEDGKKTDKTEKSEDIYDEN